MTGQAKLLLVAVFLIALATGFASENKVDDLRDIGSRAEEKGSPVTRRRELHWQRSGNYRRGKGKGKGGGRAKRGGYGVPQYGYDDDYLLAVDGGGVDSNTLIYGECLPYGGSWDEDDDEYSSSSSSSDDRARERNLRGQDIVHRRILKGKRSYGNSKGKGGGSKGSKGKGGKGGGRKRGGYDSNGFLPGDYYGNGYGFGYEYGPDGFLRPSCPPGYLYYDQLPEVEGPNRPGLGPSGDGGGTPEPPSVAPGPDGPATDGPATDGPATDGPATPEPTPPAATPDPTPAEPDGTAAPSPAGMEMDSLRVVVEDSFLEYGFFDGVTAREPTQEEIDGVVEQTNLFFTMIFENQYGDDFVSFIAENNAATFGAATDTYPVNIDFDAAVQFAEGVNPVPTRDEIFTAMQNSDLNDYIQSYVWEATPSMSGLFYDTQRVRYDARISSVGKKR